jgi:hypothetical protein
MAHLLSQSSLDAGTVSLLRTAFLVLALAKFHLAFGIAMLGTLAFVVMVFGNQATTYTKS